MTAVAEALSPTDLRKLTVKLEKEATRRASENKLATFAAYKKQREFFAAGKKHRERLLMAANRFGKTECGAAEMSYHLTGSTHRTGPASALTSQCGPGPPASPRRRPATLCRPS